MAVTVQTRTVAETPSADEYEVTFSADNDAAQVDLRQARDVVWTRVHTDVAVTWTIDSQAFDGTPGTQDWHTHAGTGLAAHEDAPLVGLRFKRTGSSGTKAYIRGYGLKKPYAVTGV